VIKSHPPKKRQHKEDRPIRAKRPSCPDDKPPQILRSDIKFKKPSIPTKKITTPIQTFVSAFAGRSSALAPKPESAVLKQNTTATTTEVNPKVILAPTIITIRFIEGWNLICITV
jgi:hypothetical protein